jgi:hypothetical protein
MLLPTPVYRPRQVLAIRAAPNTRIRLRGEVMIRRIYFAVSAAMLLAVLSRAPAAHAEQAYGRSWGNSYNTTDWERFYHYPYVYYPQNFWGSEYYRSADSLYYRYPAEMRIPVYNRHWYNEYPSPRPYYRGAHFVLDIF